VNGQRKLYELAAIRTMEAVNMGKDEPGKENIQHYSGHLLARAHVAKALQVAYQIIGLKPEHHPEAELGAIINRYVVQKYAHFTVEDVYEAFVQAVEGTITVNLKHFGQIDLPYLSAVWDAYNAYAYRSPAPKPQRLLSGPSAAELAWRRNRPWYDNRSKELLLEYYGMRLHGQVPPVLQEAERLFNILTIDFGIAGLTKDEYAKVYKAGCARVGSEHGVSAEVAASTMRSKCLTESYRITVGYLLIRMQEGGWTLDGMLEALEYQCFIDPASYAELLTIKGLKYVDPAPATAATMPPPTE
jgi:hypothetical protein